jgi:multiple sugar transport system substrate-binding protein
MDCFQYDTSVFNPALVDMYKDEHGQWGLPFAVFPSLVFYNTELFDQSGLNYPPSAYGEKYVMPDGSRVEWSWDALAAVARLLTLDVSGRNATESGFDAGDIMQYGFTWQFEQHPNYWGSYWAGGSMWNPGDNSARAPSAWIGAWKWTYEGIWGDQPFIANAAVEGSQEYEGGDPFNSNKIAMTVQPIWYTCCMQNVRTWDAAAMPAYNGKVGGRIDADTFLIWKGTKHPAEAFAAMAYLVGEGSRALLLGTEDREAAYGAVPALTESQEIWVEGQKELYPWVKNWDVVLAGLDYPDIPSAEAYMPNYIEAWTRGNTFANLLRTSPNLDLDREISAYLSDLTVIFAG